MSNSRQSTLIMLVRRLNLKVGLDALIFVTLIGAVLCIAHLERGEFQSVVHCASPFALVLLTKFAFAVAGILQSMGAEPVILISCGVTGLALLIISAIIRDNPNLQAVLTNAGSGFLGIFTGGAGVAFTRNLNAAQ